MGMDFIAEKKRKKFMEFNENSEQGRKYTAVI